MAEAKEYSVLAEKYRKKTQLITVLGWITVIVAVLCLIGLIVGLILVGIGKANQVFALTLSVSCLAGAVLFALAAFFTMRLSSGLEKKRLDYLELSDGEESFFVGEGTLAEFCADVLKIRGTERDGKKQKTVTVPYSEMRFFSVCSRRAPKEKGEWIVVLEIPFKYLSKDGKSKNEPPALIQTDAKPRLYECLKKHSLPLLGERQEDSVAKKYQRYRNFVLPDLTKRRRALAFSALGALLFIGGVVAAILWNLTVGCVVAFVGAYLLIHSASSFLKAKSVLSVYREGIFWREPTHTDTVFLKWEELVRLTPVQKEGLPFLRAECLYGAYEFPDANGAYAYIAEHFPGKCGQA